MKEEKSNELNLLELIQLFFSWIGKCIFALLNGLGYCLKIWYRYFVIVLFSVSLCVVAALYLSRDNALRYKVEAMATLNGCDAHAVKDVSRQLELSFTSNKSISFGTKLGLPDSISSNIREFHSYFVIDYNKDSIPDLVDFKDNHSLKDTVNVRDPEKLYFRFVTKNVIQVPQIEQALLAYFNSNPSLQGQFQAKRNALIENLNVCNVQIQRIDSMSKINYFKADNNQVYLEDRNVVLGGKLGKQLYYSDLLAIEKLKRSTQMQLASCNHALELPSGFVVIPEPVNDRKKYVFFSIMFGLLISLIVSIMLEYRKTIISFLKK